jgi:two-component system, OmpR family, osmolarity sensor histidine kinase EnvZ
MERPVERRRSRSMFAISRLLWPRAIKRWLPRSLFGRTLLIFVIPVVVMQLMVSWIFFDNQWRSQTIRLSQSLAGDIAWVAETYEADPTPANLALVTKRARRTLKISVSLDPGLALPIPKARSLFARLDEPLRQALVSRLNAPFWFDTKAATNNVEIRIALKEGVMTVIAPRDRAMARLGYQFIVWLTVVTLLLLSVALVFIRNQVRAIERLAEAAEAFGRGGDAASFKPHGATEVRRAAYAFIAMKERIQRHIDQRTALLASVSHDLRTPLTRLKLEIALAEPTPRTEEIKRDLAEMEHMIDEYLAFARGETGEVAEPTPLPDLIKAVAEAATRTGAVVSVKCEPGLVANLRPNTFKRALSNLIMNAAAHGERVEITARSRPSGGVEVIVDDNGPGIPPDRYEEAFKPFNRLDEARNQNEKGVGLGLAIARDAARALGGDVILDKSPLGGLRAIVRLPG